MSYNGHESKPAWNVSLWIGNDEGLYRLAKDCIRRNKTRDEATRELLGMLPAETPDGYAYSYTTVRSALRGL